MIAGLNFITGAVVERRRLTVFLGALLTAIAFFFMSALPALAETMRVTFVRHGQSFGNTSGLIDTSTPGPVLTPLGEQQAQAVADKLSVNNYDAIYASTMVRTQLTAGPMSQALRLPIQVLPGLQEIEAGIYEGTPEADALRGYLQAPLRWIGAIPTPPGSDPLDARIPGSIDGHEFDGRVDAALQTMYDNGDRNAVVFSHGGTIMMWAFMNAENADLSLLATHPLGNTGYVVLEGSPEEGWRIVNWDGIEVSEEAPLHEELALQARTLTRQLQAANEVMVQEIRDAVASGDLTKITAAINKGVADSQFSVEKFNKAVNAAVTREVNTPVPSPVPAPESFNVQTVNSTVDTGVGNVAQEAKTAVEVSKPSVDVFKPPVSPVIGNLAPKPAAVQTIEPPKVRTGLDGIGAPGGATDLANFNIATPGKTRTPAEGPDQRVRDAIQSANDQVASSLDTVRDAVRRATPIGSATTAAGNDAAPAAGNDATSASSSGSSASSSGSSTSNSGS